MTKQPCGLYRTRAAIGEVSADTLVFFHNHSDQGPPIVLLPSANRNNRWSFHAKGVLIADEADIANLVPLKPEGFYFLAEHFHPEPGRVVAKHSLVQLGYNRKAEPILFFPARSAEDNALEFPATGMRVPGEIYALLEPLDTRGPQAIRQIH